MSNLLKWKGLEINPSQLNESTTIKLPAKKKVTLEESATGDSFIMPKIEAIHTGRTKNFVHYTSDKLRGDASLKSGVYSWVDPYAKPVIYNHDVYTEATGRILRAAYADYTQAGRPGIIVVPKITDPKAVKAIQDGRLLTVSIGATTDAAICSICGTDIANEGFCGHMKGEEYDGQTAEWVAGNIWFDELSWVNVPADSDAMVVDSESSLLVPTEKSEGNKELSLNEFYNIPRGINIIEAVSSGTDSNSQKEGGEGMPKGAIETTEEEAKETEEVVETEETKEVEEPKADEKPETDETPAAEETPEVKEPEVKDEPEQVDPEPKDVEPEKTDVVKEDDNRIQALESVNAALEAENKALTEELKGYYKVAILEKVDVDEEAKEKFSERLNTRTLTGLKETWEDLEDGFFMPVKKETKRKKETVASPLKEEDEKKETKKEIDKVSFLSGMLSTKK